MTVAKDRLLGLRSIHASSNLAVAVGWIMRIQFTTKASYLLLSNEINMNVVRVIIFRTLVIPDGH